MVDDLTVAVSGSRADGLRRWAVSGFARLPVRSPAAFTTLIDQHPHVAMLLLKGLVARVRRLEAQETAPGGG